MTDPIKIVRDNNGIQSVKIPIREMIGNEPTGEYMYFDRQKDGTYKMNEDAARIAGDPDEIQMNKLEFYKYMKEILHIGKVKEKADGVILEIYDSAKDTTQKFRDYDSAIKYFDQKINELKKIASVVTNKDLLEGLASISNCDEKSFSSVSNFALENKKDVNSIT
jgi:hypothetical protein